MDPKKARLALEARGLQLGSPAEESLVRQTEAKLGLSFDVTFRQLYVEFNGFVSHDARSHISLWSLQRIVENANLSIVESGNKFLSIGDLLMDSDFIMADVCAGNSPVFLLYEKRVLAPTISALLSGIASGQFDL